MVHAHVQYVLCFFGKVMIIQIYKINFDAAFSQIWLNLCVKQ